MKTVKGRTSMGLTSDDWQILHDILKKTNDIQIPYLLHHIGKEIGIRFSVKEIMYKLGI